MEFEKKKLEINCERRSEETTQSQEFPFLQIRSDPNQQVRSFSEKNDFVTWVPCVVQRPPYIVYLLSTDTVIIRRVLCIVFNIQRENTVHNKIMIICSFVRVFVLLALRHLWLDVKYFIMFLWNSSLAISSIHEYVVLSLLSYSST